MCIYDNVPMPILEAEDKILDFGMDVMDSVNEPGLNVANRNHELTVGKNP